jgi:type III pantothenate kinase
MESFNWCIDAGNSSVKLGVFKDNSLLDFFQFRESPSAEKLKAIEENYPPSKIAVSSVVGHLNWLNFSGVMSLSAENIKPFYIDYINPSEMGLDRLTAAMGARSVSNEEVPILVVDLGTCVTYTAVKDWCISGLAISPGLQMRWNALNHFTVQLPLMDHQQKVSAKGTKLNLFIGGMVGWEKELKGMIDLFCETEHIDRVMITGSDVVHLEKHFKEQYVIVDHLNLWGLNYWLNEG